MSGVQISGLPVATSADDDDLILLRKTLTDYQCTVKKIRNLNLSALDNLPAPVNYPVNNDVMLLQRGSTNYQVAFSEVGFTKGTRMFFWQLTAPLGWKIIENTGDMLLGVTDSTTKYMGNINAGASGGTWQQEGAALSVLQIPNHKHWSFACARGAGNDRGGLASITPNLGQKYGDTLGVVGGQGDNAGHDNYGGCDPHNHGNTWRPLANVGILAEKGPNP
ncbi:MAG: hypothetical protein C5B43_01315 [Verrucomicrobia bacterium]|nr:MAG: hypothetical protein C5B43_01315 [Verrucomicrobiota bacterium]